MEFSWKINRLECKPSLNNLNQVVVLCSWTCSATLNQHHSSISAVCELPEPNEENFIPYSNLTESDVFSWVFATGVDKLVIEKGVEDKLAQLQEPQLVTLPLPWVLAAEPTTSDAELVFSDAELVFSDAELTTSDGV